MLGIILIMAETRHALSVRGILPIAIGQFGFAIADCDLPIAICPLRFVDCDLPIVICPLRFVDCDLPIVI